MNRIILTIIFGFTTLSAISQNLPNKVFNQYYKDRYLNLYDLGGSPLWGEWVDMQNQTGADVIGFVVIANENGYKKAYKEINNLLLEIGMDFDSPTLNRTFLPKKNNGKVNDLGNFKEVNKSVLEENGNLNMTWFIENKNYQFKIVFQNTPDKKYYGIAFGRTPFDKK